LKSPVFRPHTRARAYTRVRHKRIKVHEIHHVTRLVDLAAGADAAGRAQGGDDQQLGLGTGAPSTAGGARRNQVTDLDGLGQIADRCPAIWYIFH
jgi:hypothetical protein